MPGILRKRARKSGLPPGTPVYVGEERAGPVRITLLRYDAERVEEREVARVGECFPEACAAEGQVSWINVDGLHDPGVIAEIGERFGLHPLTVEDLVNTAQRPKLEALEGYAFLALKMIRPGEEPGHFEAEHVSLVLGSGYVLSFQERHGDVFDAVRERIRSAKGQIRRAGADYLAYSLLDAVVDGYFPVLERLEERLEDAGERVFASADREVARETHELKRELTLLRRSIWPLREVVGALLRVGPPLVAEGTGIYLRDVYDHTIQVLDVLESFRDEVAGLRDTYLTNVSNRMNEIMKVLTVIATIFIPVTFIAGLYGMNFKYMPELDLPWAYPAALGLMGAVAVAMLVYFRRKGWL